MNFEEELKAALGRKLPPPGFAGRVMAKVDERRDVAPARRAIAAALLMTAVLGGWTARAIQHQRDGERAREEVLTALRITSEKLKTAQQHIHDRR
jgi:hypothetical protein